MVVSPLGEIVEVVDIAPDDPIVTNICFGGPDMRTAYVTAAGRGRLSHAEWTCPGLRLHS
jgi:gluconolactonase